VTLVCSVSVVLCFFFQGEGGNRSRNVAGVQAGALPVSDRGGGDRSPSRTAVMPAVDDDGVGRGGAAGGAALGGAALGGAAGAAGGNGAAAGSGGGGYPGADGPMGAAPQYPGSSRPATASGAGHVAGSGPAHGQGRQGGASPVGNPQGNIQAGPGSPLAGADLGRSGFVQPGSGQGFVDHSGRLVRPGDQGPWQAQGGPSGQIAQPGSQ